MAHRCERIEIVVGVTGKRLAEQYFGLFRQVGKLKTLFRPFELDEVAIKLDFVFAELLDGKAKEDRRRAGVALVDESHVFRSRFENFVERRHGDRRHMSVDAAIGALQAELFVRLAD